MADRGGDEAAKRDADGEINITTDDLSNPEALIHKLEAIQLTEEDTDELLHEAYKMNKKLKEMLRRQEQGSDIQMRKIRTAGGLSGKGSSGKGSHHLNSNKSPLPPISSNIPDRNVYTAHASTRTSQQKQAAVRVQSSQIKRSPSRRKGSAETKPEWDSRFSYNS